MRRQLEALERQHTQISEKLRRSLARKSMLAFCQYTTPKWYPSRMHREICTALDAVVAGKIDRLMIACPPQHGKSSITSKRLAAYMLGRNPASEFVGISATQPLAEEFGGEIRDCIKSQAFQTLFPGTNLREDMRAKGRWKTDQGGGYYAVGIGGSLYGRGGAVLIDDPFASWEDAQSAIERKHVWNWYQGTLYNRIHPGMPVIVIQHRLHEEDLIGNLLREERDNPHADRWHKVIIKADPDNPPWPERYGREELLRKKGNSHKRQWAAMYDQDPTPEDGDEFRASWWREYTKAPTGELRIYITHDLAVTEEQLTKADPDRTAIIVWGVDHLDNVYALDAAHGCFNSEEVVKILADVIGRWKPRGLRDVIGETGPIRRSIEPFLVRELKQRGLYTNLEWLPTIGDKSARALSFRSMMSAGVVYWPATDWAERAKSELLKFPGGAHDDIVDACGLLGRHIDNVRKPQAPTPPPKPADLTTLPTIGELIRPRPPMTPAVSRETR